MDFLKILKSFEEFVFEALTWLVLMPRTLLRIVASPRRMTGYAADELAANRDTGFNDAISPPLLLILSVLVAHVVDLAARDPTPVTTGPLANLVLSSEQNLLVYRTISFGLWALAGAVYLLLRTGRGLSRENLRVPLYEQCYLVSPFALATSIATTLVTRNADADPLVGGLLFLAALAWFWGAQAGWLKRRAGLPVWRCLLAATIVVAIGSAVNAGVVAMMVGNGDTSVEAPTPGAPPEPPQ